jgi:hypothetical protein
VLHTHKYNETCTKGNKSNHAYWKKQPNNLLRRQNLFGSKTIKKGLEKSFGLLTSSINDHMRMARQWDIAL